MDLVKGYMFPNMKNEKIMMLMKILCLVFIAFSFIVAYKPNAILVLMSFSWGTVAGSFIGPFLFGLYWKGTTKLGAWLGMIGGFGTSITLAVVYNMDAGKAPLFGMIAMLVSIITVPVVSLITPKLSHSHVAEVFNTKISKSNEVGLDM
jgi:SSS family solute:Na+ symporter/sodium/proline symporter